VTLFDRFAECTVPYTREHVQTNGYYQLDLSWWQNQGEQLEVTCTKSHLGTKRLQLCRESFHTWQRCINAITYIQYPEQCHYFSCCNFDIHQPIFMTDINYCQERKQLKRALSSRAISRHTELLLVCSRQYRERKCSILPSVTYMLNVNNINIGHCVKNVIGSLSMSPYGEWKSVDSITWVPYLLNKY